MDTAISLRFAPTRTAATKPWNSHFLLRIRRTRTRSEAPSKSYADLKPQLKVQTWNLTAAGCPALFAQFTAFQNIQFVRPRDDDEVGENPILYEINETVGGGSSQVIEFIASRAIPRWANRTRKALLACAPNGDGTKTGKKDD